MPRYNLIDYSDNYSKTSGSLWQYYREEPALDNNDNIVNFSVNSAWFKSKQKQQEETQPQMIQKILKQPAVPLKYLSKRNL